MTAGTGIPRTAARFAFDGAAAAVGDQAAARGKHPGRLVVGVDGSSASVRALRWAASMAPTLGSDVEVVDVSSSSEWVYEPEGRDPVRDARQDAEQIVREVFGASPPATLHVAVEVGDPVVRLLELSRGAAMVVVGSRPRRDGIEPPDSVGLRVAALASCPVLVVH